VTAPHDTAEHWPVESARKVFQGVLVGVRRDTLAPAMPGGEPFDREVVTHPGAVGVVAVDSAGRMLVIQQYRHAAIKRMVEIPAGLLDVAGEPPIEAARRELREEGLVEAARWTPLLTYQPSPGSSEEVVHVFLAEGLTEATLPVGFEAEHEEVSLTRSWVDVDELIAAILAGQVQNGLTIAGSLAFSALRGAKHHLRAPCPT